MKSYTDLEQSKKLAEILPLESADMCYLPTHIGNEHHFIASLSPYSVCTKMTDVSIDYCIPCWSVGALINIIENIGKPQKVEISFTHNSDKYWVDVHFDEFGSFCQDYELYDSKVDALIAMIEKFKNRNLL